MLQVTIYFGKNSVCVTKLYMLLKITFQSKGCRFPVIATNPVSIKRQHAVRTFYQAAMTLVTIRSKSRTQAYCFRSNLTIVNKYTWKK